MFRVENVLFMSFRRIQTLAFKTMASQLLSTSKHLLTVNTEQANVISGSAGISIIRLQTFVHAKRTTHFVFRRLKQTHMIQITLQYQLD